jgi:ubiquinone biosynthesis protein
LIRSRFQFARTLRHAGRYRHILGVLMKYGFEDVVQHLRGRLVFRFGRKAIPRGEKPAPDGRTRPERLRLALQEMGPTFIKLGQLLSTRPDLLPGEYIRELAMLQDHVPPEDASAIRRVVERELDGSVRTLFASFDADPLAAGSIAQVHHAVLKDGREVALKVLRPGVERTLQIECEIIQHIADWLGETSSPVGTLDLPRMADELTGAIQCEVDMTVERNNLHRFDANFRNDPTVRVPQTIEEFCTEDVLTMEYIDGVKPTSAEALRAAGLDPPLLAKRGADFVLRQIFEFGVFHSDPHPGNMFMLPGNVVVAIDFGQVARLRQRDRDLLGDLVLAIVDQEPHQIIRAVETAGLIDDETDTEALLADAEELIDRYYHRPLKDIPLRDVISQIFRLIREHHLRPPAQFTMMLKSLMTIESMAMELDPQFDIIAALKPHARRYKLEQIDPRRLFHRVSHVLRDAGNLAARMPADARVLLAKARKGEFQLRVHHEHLEELTHTLDKSSNRISFALIIAALLVASSMLTPQEGFVLGLVPLQVLGVVGYCVAAVLGFWLLVSILRGRHM